ncbi:hypothetical protein [Bacillus sp. FJAT-28004]|uniref:hypothetical protein n=1 Tax=Bacillus sp. FJAT-28004 TaxID=1679165 RepID=UPI0006B65958|nr:hypothetical protein [Bacillus sp. FJAT-28004]
MKEQLNQLTFMIDDLKIQNENLITVSGIKVTSEYAEECQSLLAILEKVHKLLENHNEIL